MSSRPPSELPSASFHSPSRPTATLHPSRDVFSASFSTTQPLQRLRDRQLPVFQAFCKYLSAHDVSQATHRAAVWKAFKETAPPAVSDHFIYIRDHSDIIYRYRDQLERHFPQFMALRSYPPTTSMRGRKRLNPRPEDSIHDKIYEAFRQFLRAYDWRKPVRRGGLFLEFQGTTTGNIVSSPQALAKQNVDVAPYLVMDRKHLDAVPSYWKNFDLMYAHKLAAEFPQYGYLRNLRVPHIVNEHGIVCRAGERRLELAKEWLEKKRNGENPMGRPPKLALLLEGSPKAEKKV